MTYRLNMMIAAAATPDMWMNDIQPAAASAAKCLPSAI